MGAFWFLSRRGRQRRAIEVAHQQEPDEGAARLERLFDALGRELRRDTGWYEVADEAIAAHHKMMGDPADPERRTAAERFIEVVDLAPADADDPPDEVDVGLYCLALARVTPRHDMETHIRIVRRGFDATRTCDETRRKCVRAMAEADPGPAAPTVIRSILELLEGPPSAPPEPEVHDRLRALLDVTWDSSPAHCASRREDLERARVALPDQAWPLVRLGIVTLVADGDPPAAFPLLSAALDRPRSDSELRPGLIVAAITAGRVAELQQALERCPPTEDPAEAAALADVAQAAGWCFAPQLFVSPPPTEVLQRALGGNVLARRGGPALISERLLRACVGLWLGEGPRVADELTRLMRTRLLPPAAATALARALSLSGRWDHLLDADALQSPDALPAAALCRLAEARIRCRPDDPEPATHHLPEREARVVAEVTVLERAILTGASTIPEPPSDDPALPPDLRAEVARAGVRAALAAGNAANASQSVCVEAFAWLPAAERQALRGLVALLDGNAGAAVQRLQRACELTPANPLTRAALATAVSAAGGDPSEVRDSLEDSQGVPAQIMRVHAAVLEGDCDEAERLLEGLPEAGRWRDTTQVVAAQVAWRRASDALLETGRLDMGLAAAALEALERAHDQPSRARANRLALDVETAIASYWTASELTGKTVAALRGALHSADSDAGRAHALLLRAHSPDPYEAVDALEELAAMPALGELSREHHGLILGRLGAAALGQVVSLHERSLLEERLNALMERHDEWKASWQELREGDRWDETRHPLLGMTFDQQRVANACDWARDEWERTADPWCAMILALLAIRDTDAEASARWRAEIGVDEAVWERVRSWLDALAHWLNDDMEASRECAMAAGNGDDRLAELAEVLALLIDLRDGAEQDAAVSLILRLPRVGRALAECVDWGRLVNAAAAAYSDDRSSRGAIGAALDSGVQMQLPAPAYLHLARFAAALRRPNTACRGFELAIEAGVSEARADYQAYLSHLAVEQAGEATRQHAREPLARCMEIAEVVDDGV